MGVAVSASRCGSSSWPLACNAARWLTPNRCCSSTTANPRRRKTTPRLITACVPITTSTSPDSIPSWIARLRAGERLGVGAPVERRAHLAGIVGKVRGLECRAKTGHAGALVFVQGVLDVSKTAAQDSGEQLAHSTLRDSPDQRIDRDDAAGMNRRGARRAEVG